MNNLHKNTPIDAKIKHLAQKSAYEMFKVGGRCAVIIDALKEDVKKFYMKYGFKELANKNLILYLPMKQIAKLFPEN